MLPLAVLVPVVSIEPSGLAPFVVPGLFHAGLRSRAGVLGKGRAAQEGKSGDGD